MKKLFTFIFTLIVLLSSAVQVSAAQVVVLGPSNETLAYKEFTAHNDTVLTALKKTGLVYVDEGDKYPQFEGSYITEIAGYGVLDVGGWVYTVNNVSPNVAASECKVDNDDKIIWSAYSNADNMKNYKFPETVKEPNKDSSKDIIKESNKDINKQVDEIMSGLDLSELEQKTESEELPADIKEEDNIDTSIDTEPYEKQFDYRNLGYVGLIICFILGISFYKLVKDGKNE